MLLLYFVLPHQLCLKKGFNFLNLLDGYCLKIHISSLTNNIQYLVFNVNYKILKQAVSAICFFSQSTLETFANTRSYFLKQLAVYIIER